MWWLRHYLYGICIGVADVVPGVSGGTIALLLGIYPRIIHIISGISWRTLRRPASIDWGFVLPLLGGVFSSFLLFAHGARWLLAHYEPWVLSFFAGLIWGATLGLYVTIPRQKRAAIIMFLLVGAVIGTVIDLGIDATTISVQAPSNYVLFFIGALACAVMLLPGISGSFILVVLGYYGYMLTALTDRKWGDLALFAAGGVVGLLTIAKLLYWLLKKYPLPTMGVLIGILLWGGWTLSPMAQGLRTATGSELVCTAAGLAVAWALRSKQGIEDMTTYVRADRQTPAS